MNATTNLASLVKVNLSTDIIRMKGSSRSLILNDDISGLNIKKKSFPFKERMSVRCKKIWSIKVMPVFEIWDRFQQRSR
jgi:hypothetical protein